MRLFLFALAIAFTSIMIGASPAEAHFLHWYRGPVHATSEGGCYGFAHDAATKNNLQNIKRDNLSVSGTTSSGDAYAVITCVGGGGGEATAIVMVSSDNGPVGDNLAKALFDVVRKEVCFEGC